MNIKPHNPLLPSERERGQSLVEFSFMVIILTVLLLGILDIGRAYFTYIALLDAATEGATYASVYPTKWCNDSHDYFAGCEEDYESDDPNNIVYRVVESASSGTMVDWAQTTVEVELEGEPPVKPGRRITISLTTQYQLLTPFIGSIVGSQMMPLRAEAAAVVLTP